LLCVFNLQMGHLDVVVPPDIVNEDTSGDVMVPEGGTVKLTCRARGYPTPHVLWRREDNSEIVIREPSGVKTKGQSVGRYSNCSPSGRDSVDPRDTFLLMQKVQS
jgi:Immunoglobulin domain